MMQAAAGWMKMVWNAEVAWVERRSFSAWRCEPEHQDDPNVRQAARIVAFARRRRRRRANSTRSRLFDDSNVPVPRLRPGGFVMRQRFLVCAGIDVHKANLLVCLLK